MPMRRGEEWGSIASLPEGIPVARNDQQANLMLREGCREFLLREGDMVRTVGGVLPSPSCSYRRLPLDLVTVTLVDDSGASEEVPVFSHCVVCTTPWRGGVLRGAMTLVCNSQFVFGLDAAPRGHPNDGRVEILEIDADLHLRQRIEVFRRMRTGDHLPHPSIRVRHVSSAPNLRPRGWVLIDRSRHRTSTLSHVRVTPDAIVLWVAAPSLLQQPDPHM